MSKRVYIRIDAGNLVKEALYDATDRRAAPDERARRARATSAVRQAINDKTAVGRLELLLAKNFEPGHVFLTVTYREAHYPSGWDEAEKRLRAYIRVLRRELRRLGRELKYIYVTQDVYGNGRIHHHMALNATMEDVELLRSLWRWGDQVELAPLLQSTWGARAEYMTQEGYRRGVGKRMWTPSKNLLQPTVTKEEWPGNAMLEVPPGAFVIDNPGPQRTDGVFYQYMKYWKTPPPYSG